jgi:hypothetical protein
MNMPGLSAEASLYKSSGQYFVGTGWAGAADSGLRLSQLRNPILCNGPCDGDGECKPISGPCNLAPPAGCACAFGRLVGSTCDPPGTTIECCTAAELTTTTPCAKNATTGVCESTTTNRCTSPPTVTTTACQPTCGSCVGGSCGCDNYPTCARTPGTITCTDACGTTTTKSC